MDAAAFRYTSVAADAGSGVVELHYALDDLPFTEVVRFPPPEVPPDGETFTRVAELLHLAAGTSYYKAAAPRSIVVEGYPVAAGVLPWLTALYRDGLGEYAYRNDLPHVLDATVTTPHGTGPDATPRDAGHGRPLVAVGGGKDSIVSIEALRGSDPVLFAVNPNRIITDVVAASGLPSLAARRRLDPALLELNASGRARNGHIPVTAINSLVAIGTSVLHGLGPVVMSNERSASVPNLTWHGRDINHQWSKGLDAEALLRSAVAAHAGLADAYFSLLRPLSELHIAKLFTATDRYDAVVTSCNQAFKLSGASDRWCGQCPKCRFVYLAMAPFASRERMVAIFGADLLDDASQVDGYRELAGLSAHKPWECVGEIEESQVALRMLAELPQWRSSAVVRSLAGLVPAVDGSDVFEPAAIGFVPPRYAKVLD